MSNTQPPKINKFIDSLSVQRRDYIAYSMMSFACFFWTYGFIYANQHNMSGVQTSLSRYTIFPIVSYFHATAIGSKWQTNLKTPFYKILARGVIFSVHSLVVASVQFYLPLNVFHTLGSTGPVFVFISNYLFHGVKITKTQSIGLVMCFLGLALIINGRLFNQIIYPDYQFYSEFQNYHTDNVMVQIMVAALYLVWTFVWSIAVVFTQNDHYNGAEMMFIQSCIAIPIYAISYFYVKHSTTEVYLGSLLWVSSILIFANYLFTYTFILASNTGKASVMVMFSVVISYALTVFKYNEKLNFFAVIGTLIVMVAVSVVILSKN